jgi:hypothetical protein
VMKQLRAALPAVARDALGLTGAASISYGTWIIYRPAGFIVAGSLLLAACLLLARAE